MTILFRPHHLLIRKRSPPCAFETLKHFPASVSARDYGFRKHADNAERKIFFYDRLRGLSQVKPLPLCAMYKCASFNRREATMAHQTLHDTARIIHSSKQAAADPRQAPIRIASLDKLRDIYFSPDRLLRKEREACNRATD